MAKDASILRNQALAFVFQNGGALNETAATVGADGDITPGDCVSVCCRMASASRNIASFESSDMMAIGNVGVTTEGTPIHAF